MTVSSETLKRLSAAERRLKAIEALVGTQAPVNELSDFPEKSEWFPGETVSSIRRGFRAETTRSD